MTRLHRKAITLIALSTVAFAPGCDSADRLESITSPTIAYGSGSNSGNSGNSGKGSRKELLRRYQALLNEQVALVEINPSGGELRVGDHKLIVPKKAVDKQTWFFMRLVPGDYIHVQLFAWDAKTYRQVTQFKNPVKLVLSYADARPEDENKLGVAYLAENNPLGRQEKMGGTAVDRWGKTVTALLPHFSEWVMVID